MNITSMCESLCPVEHATIEYSYIGVGLFIVSELCAILDIKQNGILHGVLHGIATIFHKANKHVDRDDEDNDVNDDENDKE